MMASFTSRTVETLIDLVEIKLSYLDITDRDDRAESRLLKQALAQLTAQRSHHMPAH
ncbi:MAG: hypothetical protein WCC64_08505 [Aliidongia sp.]|jgi:hypothetical protein